MSNLELHSSAKVIANSIGPTNVKLTTMEVVMPRYILPEFNTHRAFCLSGDSLIQFDRPDAVEVKRFSQVTYKLSDLYTIWKNDPKKVKSLHIRNVNEETGKVGWAKISKVIYSGVKTLFTIRTRKGKCITCSADHRLLTDKGWQTLTTVGALRLPTGEMYIPKDFKLAITKGGRDVSFEKVTEIEYKGQEPCYDLSIDSIYHNFIANNIVLHNSKSSCSCLTKDTVVTFNMSYATKINKYHRYSRTIQQIVESWDRDPDTVKTWDIRILNEDTKIYQTAHISNVFKQGVQDVYKITLKNGKTLTCTENHRIFTDKGWTTLKDQKLNVNNGITSWSKTFPKVATNGELISKEDLIKEISSGKTYGDIAKEREINFYSLVPLANEFGIVLCLKNVRNKTLPYYVTKEDIQKYKDLQYCNGRIGEMLGVPEHIIKRAVVTFKLAGTVGKVLVGNKRRCPWNTGLTYKQKEESLVNVRAAAIKRRIPESWLARKTWQQGRTDFLTKIKESILQKFNYKCVATGSGQNLELHHVIPCWYDKTKIFDVDNIVLLSKEFHRFLHHRNLDIVFMDAYLSGEDLSQFATKYVDVYMKCLDINKPKAPGKLLLCKYSQVTNIEYMGKQETYDLEVDGEYHNFVANGIVVHNSRSIPSWKKLLECITLPVVPEFQKNKSGMQSTTPLTVEEQDKAEQIWLQSRDYAVAHASVLTDRLYIGKAESDAWKTIDDYIKLKCPDILTEVNQYRVHKQWVNRLLEPYMWHTVIVTATDWDNFFKLRYEKSSQPEIQIVARKMLEAYTSSIPTELNVGDYHLPYVQEADRGRPIEEQIMISVASCARVSYMNHDGKRHFDKDVDLYQRLLESKHMSPFEHVAITTNCKSGNTYSGNFRGWIQYRKTLADDCFSGIDLKELLHSGF